jgi:N-acetylmuramoyl-L-alanine amidase
MIYLSAGHTPKGLHPDPGAIGNGYKEAELTVELRDLIVALLKERNVPVWIDDDTQRLPDVLKAITSTEKDVVCDLHFNAGPAGATGVEILVPARHTDKEMTFARSLCADMAQRMCIKHRGVKTEADSQHGSLGIMRELGINLLIEVCFISNANDMRAYQFNKTALAMDIAWKLELADKAI